MPGSSFDVHAVMLLVVVVSLLMASFNTTFLVSEQLGRVSSA